MAETIISKIVLRRGNLADLPILEPGEQGYATDARRLFIGNEPVVRYGDGTTKIFSFATDLGSQTSPTTVVDTLLDYKYAITINGVDQQKDADYYIRNDGKQIEFTSAPVVGAVIKLSFNTELLTFTPDREDDPTIRVMLPGSATEQQLPELTIDRTRYDNCTINYTMICNNNVNMRKGTINIGLMPTTHTISDQYDTMDDVKLPHAFSIVDNGDFAVLAYTTTDPDQASFSFKTNFWKS